MGLWKMTNGSTVPRKQMHLQLLCSLTNGFGNWAPEGDRLEAGTTEGGSPMENVYIDGGPRCELLDST